MASRFKFTLLAASYSAPGIEVQRPFQITLPGDDPRIELFRNPSFKEEAVAGNLPPTATATDAGDGSTSEGDTPIAGLTEHGIPNNVVDALKENGYDFAEDVLAETPADLVAIKGIGEATANKVFDACKALVDAAK